MKALRLFFLCLTMAFAINGHSQCKEIFDAGVKLYNNANYTEAIAKFKAAKQCSGALSSQCNAYIAKCNTEIKVQNDYQEAVTLFTQKEYEKAKKKFESVKSSTSRSTMQDNCKKYLAKIESTKSFVEVSETDPPLDRIPSDFNGIISITINANLPWKAQVANTPDWCRIVSSATGSDVPYEPQTIKLQITPNTSSEPRFTNFNIINEQTALKTIEIKQHRDAAFKVTSYTGSADTDECVFTKKTKDVFINIESDSKWELEKYPEWLNCTRQGDNVLHVSLNPNAKWESGTKGYIMIVSPETGKSFEIKVAQYSATMVKLHKMTKIDFEKL